MSTPATRRLNSRFYCDALMPRRIYSDSGDNVAESARIRGHVYLFAGVVRCLRATPRKRWVAIPWMQPIANFSRNFPRNRDRGLLSRRKSRDGFLVKIARTGCVPRRIFAGNFVSWAVRFLLRSVRDFYKRWGHFSL